MDMRISISDFTALRQDGFGPLTIDVRRPPRYDVDDTVVAGAIRRDPETIADWWRDLELARPVVVYCVHGHEVSQGAAANLRERGVPARYLDGGIEGWRMAGGALAPKPGPGTRWVTRERPKIDRIACPWLIRRFIDPDARFLFVPPGEVFATAERTGATAFDIPGADYSHDGERCSFDAFIEKHGLADPALERLAAIVRGADTSRLDLTPHSPGLFAISLGLGAVLGDDQELLRYGLVVYDALYTWIARLADETHAWPPHLPGAARAA